jgi:uncharacterized phage protein (TIGR02220 family)
MAKEGWFRFSRRLLSSDLWLAEPFTRGQAWIDLVGLAKFEDGSIRKRGIHMEIPRGVCSWSENELAERWQWSRGKVRRFLRELETVQQIVQQKNNVTTCIYIVNYERYQTDGTADGTANGQQTVQQNGSLYSKDLDLKNVKKGKKEKKTITSSRQVPLIPHAEIIAHLNHVAGRRFQANGSNRRLIEARWHDGHRVLDFLLVHWHKTSTWRTDPKMSDYLRPSTLYRPSHFSEYVEAAIRWTDAPPQRTREERIF